ncbi:hypothetical protein ACERIT_11790 [Halopenitus sp. H-Gu1]|uniref:hypothetical protein n=1 Tax=Halopenitus sp. H-Gu1 TaxID=3242697 RepID=UPI00359E7091
MSAGLEAIPSEAASEISSVMDEKHGGTERRRISFAHWKPTISGDVGDVVFPGQLDQKRRCKRGRACLGQPCLGVLFVSESMAAGNQYQTSVTRVAR